MIESATGRAAVQRSSGANPSRAGGLNFGTFLPPACAIAVLLLIELLLPLRTAVQLGGDEGFELAKAALCLHGHHLYSEVWNDQPPLHTFLITQVLRVFPRAVLGPRLVTVLFAVALMASFFVMVRRVSGAGAAVLAGLLLVVSPGFPIWSGSCMLEIPSLATSMAGMAVLVAAPEGKWRAREIAGGALFGLALLMKLAPAYLLPLAAGAIWFRRYDAVERKGTKRREAEKREEAGEPGHPKSEISHRKIVISRWGLLPGWVAFGFAVVLALVVADLGIERGAFLLHFGQTWASHFGAAKSFEYGSASEHGFEWPILVKHWEAAVPALGGIFFGIAWRKSPVSLFPVAWLAWSLLVFGLHKPWWPYYYVHTAVPLCWCAGIGLTEAWRLIFCGIAGPRSSEGAGRGASREAFGVRLLRGALRGARGRAESGSLPEKVQSGAKRPHSRRFARHGIAGGPGRGARVLLGGALGAWAVAAALWAGTRVRAEILQAREGPQTYYSLVLGEMARYKPFTKWLYAEEPIYSFYADIPMPPDLAVVMLKRMWSGEMTNERLAAELRDLQPGLILLKNDSRPLPYDDLLAKDYQLVYVDTEHRLYAGKATSSKPRR